jgi:hypothetical protein
MDRRERYENLQELLLAALSGWQQELWTAIPCIVQSFDESNQTITAQPAVTVLVKNFPDANIQGVVTPDKTGVWVTLPLLVDVPVCFPNGGGYTLTFPITQGDEALVVFSARCLDSWWGTGGIQNPTELRSHDLSDGIAFVGLRSTPRLLESISVTSTQLRSDDGLTVLDLTSGQITLTATNVVINSTDTTINATGTFAVNSPTSTFSGTVTAQGEGTFNGGHTVSQHTHTQPADSHGDTEQPTNTPTG